MRSIAQPFLRRPVLTVVCSLLILLAGCTALFGLGLEDLPPLAPTRVSVNASFPAASPEVVEQSVTRVLEQQLNGLEGVESISSTSRQGGASISLRFNAGDPELNAIKVQNEVNLASRRLPQAATTTESMSVAVPLRRETLRRRADRAKSIFRAVGPACYKLVGVFDASTNVGADKVAAVLFVRDYFTTRSPQTTRQSRF